MTPVQRHKQYKNRKPEETITIIQGLLKEKLGITTYERLFQERNGLFHSCRLVLDNGSWLRTVNIGTNGKGMTESYSRASAYGELMERIQNYALLRFANFATHTYLGKHKEDFPFYYKQIAEKDLVLPFRYAPDEIISADNEKLGQAIDNYICSADNRRVYEKAKNLEHYYIPYYDVKGDCLAFLPYDLLYNSISTNGMCAGNTAKEALIEGLSEILERYVIRKIYFDNVTLPEIPRELFSGNEIFDRIQELGSKEGYTIKIVDCSLGVGIPAVGAIILMPDGDYYQFHMGVDPSPITALERSLTELFQGRSAVKFKTFDKSFQQQLLNDTLLKEEEMHKTNSASTGNYPASLFYKIPSYEFSGFDDNFGHSDDMDLEMLTSLIDRLGFRIYVRDNSFLGFPTYSIYIPGMSEIHNTSSLRYFEATYGEYETLFVKAHQLEHLDRKDVAYIQDSLDLASDNYFALVFPTNDVWMSAADIEYERAKLSLAYGENPKTDIVHEFDSASFFSMSANCFNCNDCRISSSCRYIQYLPILKKLMNIQASSIINQMSLQSVFK